MKYLFVGDPHATPDDLKDLKELLALVWGQAKRHNATVILAGDLYHTHAIIHAEVQYAWWNFFDDLKNDNVRCIALKGNHDAPGDLTSEATALIAHIDQVIGVLYSPFSENGIVFCPYTDGKTLVEWSELHPECNTLICHQTFDGSVYENGFFAGDGVDPNLIKQKRIISGHIHTPQEFFKVWYPGAPRWRTLNDANVERAIWLLDFDDQGNLMKREPIDTGIVCRRIYSVVDSETNLLPKHLPRKDGDVYHVEIRGSQKFIEERRVFWDAWGARIRTVRTDGRTEIKVKESEGVGVAFNKFVDVFEPVHGTPRERLKRMAEEHIGVL